MSFTFTHIYKPCFSVTIVLMLVRYQVVTNKSWDASKGSSAEVGITVHPYMPQMFCLSGNIALCFMLLYQFPYLNKRFCSEFLYSRLLSKNLKIKAWKTVICFLSLQGLQLDLWHWGKDKYWRWWAKVLGSIYGSEKPKGETIFLSYWRRYIIFVRCRCL